MIEAKKAAFRRLFSWLNDQSAAAVDPWRCDDSFPRRM